MVRGKIDHKMWITADDKELNYDRDLADDLMGRLNEANVFNLTLLNDLEKIKSVRDKRQAQAEKLDGEMAQEEKNYT